MVELPAIEAWFEHRPLTWVALGHALLWGVAGDQMKSLSHTNIASEIVFPLELQALSDLKLGRFLQILGSQIQTIFNIFSHHGLNAPTLCSQGAVQFQVAVHLTHLTHGSGGSVTKKARDWCKARATTHATVERWKIRENPIHWCHLLGS